MILIDTSVLIGYLKGFSGEPYKKFDEILNNNISFGINNFIYQEVLQGVLNEREFDKLKEYLDTFNFYDLSGRDSYVQAAKLYFKCRKHGISIRSTIDLLIAQTAIENDLYLLHNDKDYDKIAKISKELKIY